MTKEEISLQITLKAIEAGYVGKLYIFKDYSGEQLDSVTEYHAKAITDFYNLVLKKLNEEK